MKYFLIAGEASGDIHGSELIRSIRERDADAEIRFFGGDKMQDASGVAPIVHYRDMAYMGFVEVAKHLGTILGFMSTAKQIIDQFTPDALILIDYPSFNLKVAKYAYSRGIRSFYFISPKVWAWKEYRVKQIKKYITTLYSILPFETEFFARHDYDVEYVGNPTVKEIADARAGFVSEEEFKVQNGLDSRPIIALVPGSRKKEISDNLPVMIQAAKKYPGYQMVIAGAPNIPLEMYSQVASAAGVDANVPVLQGKSFQLVGHAKAALVTSGTATLETACLGTPQVVCFRMNGSKWIYKLYSMMLKVRYVSLPNLIVDREVIPELLLHHCTVENVAMHLGKLLEDTPERAAMLGGYNEMKARLTDANCTDNAAERLINTLKRH